MPERLDVNVTLARSQSTGQVSEFFAYHGAIEVQIAGAHHFTMEFRGMVPGPAVGADASARMADAETKVKAELAARLDALKAVIPGMKAGPQTGA